MTQLYLLVLLLAWSSPQVYDQELGARSDSVLELGDRLRVKVGADQGWLTAAVGTLRNCPIIVREQAEAGAVPRGAFVILSLDSITAVERLRRSTQSPDGIWEPLNLMALRRVYAKCSRT